METNANRYAHASCPVCGSNDATDVFELASPYLPNTTYKIRRCVECNHRYACGPVSAEVLDQVYSIAFHGTSQQRAANAHSAVAVNAERRAKWLYEKIGAGALLDVGAGRGYFVKAASRNFDAQGIDYSSAAPDYGREQGVRMVSGDFLEALYPDQSFDVLTLWDVLASMPNIQATVKQAARLLRPGGHVVMTIPMGESMACKIAGKRWPLWIPPVNLHYFSTQSVQHLLREAGFEVVLSKAFAKQVSCNFLLLKLARSFGLPKAGEFFTKLPLSWAIPINLGDILTIVARKT